MDLYGTTESDLTSALISARRLRGHPVHPETLGHWSDLLQHAREEMEPDSVEPINLLVVELERELAYRSS